MFASVALEILVKSARTELHRLLKEVMDRFGSGVGRFAEPHPLHVHAAVQVRQAFFSMQNATSPGKHVIEVHAGDEVKVSISK